MTLQEILSEITEKYPHGLSNDSVIRKINQVQNELFRTIAQVRTASIYNLQAGVFAYALPFPRSSLCDVVVDGVEYTYQDSKKRSDTGSFYYFLGDDGLGIYPTPDKDVVDGLALFYFKRPEQLTESDLSAVPELDEDFHMILVYGALVQICENFQETAMINNFTAKYNGLVQEFQRVNDETPDYPVIEDVMGGWF
ncbi:phage adaptor protein [Paenibacillus urinalis]|uniref:phage adaptor protein n=1 Tax=Paenibacillus urinalis TaxID=521520 RepID=UPI001961A251